MFTSAVLLAALAYVAVAGLAWWGQDAMLFPAPEFQRKDLDIMASRLGATPVDMVTSDGVRIYGWHHPARRSSEQKQRAVLHFHGNAEIVAGNARLHHDLSSAGWDVLVIAYRGYPGSEGHPSQHGLHLDALASWAWLTETLGVPADRVVVHGRSLGGGVTGTLMGEVHPAGFVLESTFTSVVAMAQSQFPVLPARLLLRHPFDTLGAADRVTEPVLIIHGEHDDIIGVSHGRALSRAFSAGRYLEVSGPGHNDGILHPGTDAEAQFLAFLDEVSPD